MLRFEIKPYFLILLFSLAGMIGRAQKSQINLVNSSSNFQTTEIEFNLGEYQLKQIILSSGISNIIKVEDGVPLLQKGAPDLPKFSTSIIIPSAISGQIEVIDVDYFEIQPISIAPSLGNFYRNEPLANRNREYSETYSNGGFFPSAPAKLGEVFNFKGLNGQTVSFQPFAYDANAKVLRVYNTIRIRVTNNSTQNIDLSRDYNRSEQELFKQHFINYPIFRSSGDNNSERLVIISTPEYIPDLNEFISWKRSLGFEIEFIEVPSGNSAVLIKNELLNLYQTNPFQYILIIGDEAQVSTPIIYGGAGDPTYGYLIGDDAYPEAFVGRLSAENTFQLKSQLNKIITYEKGLSLINLSNVAGIASELGPGDDFEYDYEHIRNIHNQLISNGYLQAEEFFEGSQSGGDAPGNPSAFQINSSLNNGLGLLFYTGHGTKSSFTTSGFSTENISALNNINSWPFICSVACLNGDFIEGTCLGESFLRANSNGQPTGAIAAFMSSVNQSWNPPMSAQDEMANIIAGNYPDLTNYSLGNICALSCLKMIQDYDYFGCEMASTWQLFGDPTMVLRTRQAAELLADYPQNIQVNATFIDVISNVENSKVSILQNGQLIGLAFINGGVASVTIERLQSLDSLEIVVSAFNHVPHIGSIGVLPSNEAFVSLRNLVFNDSQGNNNQNLDYSERVYLEFELSNLGLMASDSIKIQLLYNSEYIEINNNDCHINSIDVLQVVDSPTCIEFSISSQIEDLQAIHFELLVNVGDNQTFSILVDTKIHAPKLTVSSFEIEELTGNFNGRADPGESILLKISNQNIGHAISPEGQSTLNSTSNHFDNQISLIDSIGVNSISMVNFQVDIPSNIAPGTSFEFNYELECEAYISQQLLLLKVGALIEDAESSHFTSFPWNNTHANPWLVDNTQAFDGNSSFKSATIFGGDLSELTIHISIPTDDSIRFYSKVSSELNWDLLTFYVDEIEIAEWSGEIDWNYSIYPISGGAHELSWVYSKDHFVSSGLDAAWIDHIEFPVGVEFITSNEFVKDNSEFLVYPNPSNGTFQIKKLESNYEGEIELFDIQGQLIDTIVSNSFGIILLPANIHAGIYLIKIKDHFYKLVYSPI